ARHWEGLLGLIAEVALEPSFPGEEIERERRLILSQIKTRAETPFTLSLDALLRELYGSHPYAWPGLGLPSAVGRFARGELVAHYRAVFQAERVVLAVSGQVSHARVVRTAELERIRQAPVGREELARAKAYLLGNFALDRRTNARQAWYLAFFEVIGAGWDFPERYAQALDAVTAADVEAAAQRFLVRPTIV